MAIKLWLLLLFQQLSTLLLLNQSQWSIVVMYSESLGYRVVCEQVSHHPPVSAFHVDSPDYTFHGAIEPKLKFWGKSVEITPKGHVTLVLHRYFIKNIFVHFSSYLNFSVLCLSALTLLVSRQEEHLACKNWVMWCWCGYLLGAVCRLFAYGPADVTASWNPIIFCLI